MENVSLCLSRFALGRKMFIPLVRLAFAKCFMNVASTCSMSRTTCYNKWSREDKIKTVDSTRIYILFLLVENLINILLHQSFPGMNYQPFSCKALLHPSKLSIKHSFSHIIYNPKSKVSNITLSYFFNIFETAFTFKKLHIHDLKPISHRQTKTDYRSHQSRTHL